VNAQVVATFLALLTLVAGAGVLLTLLAVGGARLGALGTGVTRVRGALQPAALWLAFGVALVATAGSLYFSEVANFTPCVLCWYQRIAMYPLVLIVGIAAVRSDFGIRRYAGALAVVGALISAYHIAVERLPGLPTGSCSLAAPCDLIWVERFGFITIPVMALVAFAAISTALLVYGSAKPEELDNVQTK
jgi:disulfide bond formation protein DsbB